MSKQNTKSFNPLYGVNGGPGAFWPDTPGPTFGFKDVVKQYQDIGVERIRVHDFFGAGDMMEFFPVNDPENLPNPEDDKNYYWDETDLQFSNITKGNFGHQIQLGQGWRNMAGWAPFPEMPLEGYQLNSENPTNFWPNINAISAQLAPHVLLKYLDRILSKWEIDPDENYYVEFWNEPNIQSINSVPPCPPLPPLTDEEFLNTTFRNYEWDGTPLEFFQLFELYAKAIKDKYPKIKIGGPGLWSPAADPEKYPYNPRWISLFFKYVGKHEVPMDFIGWNVYSDDPGEFDKNYDVVQGYLDGIGYTHTEQMITEYAISFGNKTTLPDGRKMPNSLLAKGAAIATSLWINLQKFENLAMAYYYRGNDGPFVPEGAGFPIMLTQDCDGGPITNSNQNNFGPAGVGMFHGDGRWKPTAMAFQLWSEMAKLERLDPADYITSAIPYGGTVYLLAGKNDNGDLIVLGSYRNDVSTLKASLAISGSAAGGVMKTVLDEEIGSETLCDLQRISVQPNRAFQITVAAG